MKKKKNYKKEKIKRYFSQKQKKKIKILLQN